MTRFSIPRAIFILTAALASACATTNEPTKVHPVVKMAQFDLDCPRDELSYTKIDDDTYGVVGCGKRIKYVRVCRQKGFGAMIEDECRWVAN